MWNGDRRFPGEEILVDPEGQVHRLCPILPKKWEIKYGSSTNKPTEKNAAKLSTLQRLIRGEKPISFDNRQTHQTKAASSRDKIIDFRTDATYSNRIPKHVSIVDDSNRNDFLKQEKYKRQSNEDQRFKLEMEEMRAAKQLKVLQDSYRRRGYCHIISWNKRS